MATIGWGSGSGADTELTFAGNTTLASTRIVSAAVQLDFDSYTNDANTVLHAKMDEDHWDLGEYDILDSSGNGHHGFSGGWNGAPIAQGNATTTADWKGKCGYNDGTNYDSGIFFPLEGFRTRITGDFTAECYFKRSDQTLSLSVLLSQKWIDTPTPLVALYRTKAAQYWWADSDEVLDFSPSFIFPHDGVWHHLAFGRNGNTCYLHYDGGAASTGNLATSNPTVWTTNGALAALNNPAPVYRWIGKMADYRISDVVRYSPSGFTPPGLFKASGTTIVGNNTTAGRISSVDASVTTSAGNAGKVTKVEVKDNLGAWNTVASDAAGVTFPVTGLSTRVTTGDLLRLTMIPKDDTLKTESAIVNWVKADIGAAGVPVLAVATIL